MSFVQDAIENEYQKARAYRLYVVNRRLQTPHLVALAAVYGIPRCADLADVRTRLDAIRSLLLDRTFDLARFEKRFPVYGLVADEHYCDQDRLLNAFKLCCWCRPSGVIYPPKTQKKRIRSCGHYNFCTACWARVVEQQFRQYEAFVAACTKANPLQRLYATTHITEQFIPFAAIDAIEHADDATHAAAVECIGKHINRYKRYLLRNQKQVNRKTAASLWRLVPIAADGGWRLQFRRFFLTFPGVRPLRPVFRGSRTVFNETVLLSGAVSDDAVISFIPFAAYPEEHLKDDLDLTSASLNAMARQHMLGGTGKFRTAGKGLIDAARKASKANKAEKSNATQKTA